LPINRLRLAIGEQAEIRAAWVLFPSLKVQAATQRYDRLDEHIYRYTSTASGFTAKLRVDPIGLALCYEGIWECVAQSGSTVHAAS
jgi:uncharacterized protein